MKPISFNLPRGLLERSDRCAEMLHISRSAYIRRALERMNREVEAGARADRMARASRRVRGNSMRVNAEFGLVERDPYG